ncbi:hypothetical protein [Flavobacterium sp.]|uniref:hypothetical protein n=1 Tax=Flavobacterium sp. TaxID=239 RepID=UPI00334123F8
METTNKNKLLYKIVEERKGLYCHAIEVTDKYNLQSIIEAVFDTYESEEITATDIFYFFDSIEVYHLTDDELTEEQNEENEKEVYNFNFKEYINPTI